MITLWPDFTRSKRQLLVTDLAVVAGSSFCMTLFADFHLHGGSAVAGDLVFMKYRHLLLLRHIAVALNAFDAFRLVSGMREVDVIWLPCINLPGDLSIFWNVLFHQNPLVFGAAELRLMALDTLVELRDTGIRAVVSECVAFFAAGILVGDVAEVDRLQFLRIEEGRKDDPAERQGKEETKGEKTQTYQSAGGTLLFMIIHRIASTTQILSDSHPDALLSVLESQAAFPPV
jgi:hypothetical protein